MAASPHVPYFDPESPVFRAHEGGKLGVHATKPLRGPRGPRAALHPRRGRGVARRSPRTPPCRCATPRGATPWPSISDGTAVLGLGDIGPLGRDAGHGGQGGALQALRRHRRRPGGHGDRHRRRAGRGDRPDRARRTAGSTSRTSRRRAASRSRSSSRSASTSRSSTTTSTAPRSSCSPALLNAREGARPPGARPAGRRLRRRGGRGRRDPPAPARRGARRRRAATRAASSRRRARTSPATRAALAASTNPRGLHGRLGEALDGADVFVGVSGGQVPEEEIASMAPRGIVFALANPTPEVHPDVARRHAAVVATGRSDFPNQINNVLAFPGIFRGALDAGATADHRGDEARGGPRHRGPRRRADGRLHRAVGVPGGCRRGGGGRGAGARPERRPPGPPRARLTRRRVDRTSAWLSRCASVGRPGGAPGVRREAARGRGLRERGRGVVLGGEQRLDAGWQHEPDLAVERVDAVLGASGCRWPCTGTSPWCRPRGRRRRGPGPRRGRPPGGRRRRG